jgi:hypothetical protein
MARDAWCAATGKSRECGRLVQSTVCPSDELAQPSATGSETVQTDRDPSGRFVPGNRTGKARRLRPDAHGALGALEALGDPAHKVAVRWGKRYGAHRRQELAKAFGAISAGVGAIIESAAGLLADARYWRARGIAESNADHSRLAAQLTAQARGCERDAWELASRETAARPAVDPLAAARARLAAIQLPPASKPEPSSGQEGQP